MMNPKNDFNFIPFIVSLRAFRFTAFIVSLRALRFTAVRSICSIRRITP
jgi:hypothetical protein